MSTDTCASPTNLVTKLEALKITPQPLAFKITFYEHGSYGADGLLLNILLSENSSSKKYDTVLLFLRCVVGEFSTENYTLLSVDLDSRSTNDAQDHLTGSDDSKLLKAGNYTFRANEGSPKLCCEQAVLRIIPRGSVGKRRSTTSSTHSPSASNESLTTISPSIVSETLAIADSEEKRTSTFREWLCRRDTHCLISNSVEPVEASHVLAQSWWANTSRRRSLLPIKIRDIIQSLPDGIHDFRNGLLLSHEISKAYDKGHISVIFDNISKKYRAIAIRPEWEKYDGAILDVNTRVRADGKSWGSFMPPPELLKDWHLKMSVLNNLRGNAEDNDNDDEDEPLLSAETLYVREEIRRSYDYLPSKLFDHITDEVVLSTLST